MSVENHSRIRIRAARPGDLAALDALFARSYPRQLRADYPPSIMVTVLPLISRANPGLLSSGTFYVAETENGALLGAGGWTRSRRRPRQGDIRHVVTDDRALRRGIGRAVMATVFETARADGQRMLACQSTRTAEPFYTAMGFRRLGAVEVPLRPGIVFPAIEMIKRL